MTAGNETSGIEQIEIERDGLRVSILTIGAAIFDLTVPVRGEPRKTVLSLDSPEAYRNNPHYLGVIAGRCANRIRDGHCVISGREFQLDRNEKGITHLHGGKLGFSRKIWTIASRSRTSVELRLQSPDGEMGYPGNARISCTYDVPAANRLRITLRAQCDADTLMNLAAHSYFNLQPGSSVLDHALESPASSYTPVDANLIPDGRILPVDGTAYDFRQVSKIGERRQLSASGYDHNFVLSARPVSEPQLAARLVSPSGDLAMSIRTMEPGLQFYDGQKLPAAGEPGGSRLRRFAGCCLEPQRFPDAIHHPNFAQALLKAGEEYVQITEYIFET